MRKVIYIGSFSPGEEEKEELTKEVVREIRKTFLRYTRTDSVTPIIFCFGVCHGGDIVSSLDLAELIMKYRGLTVALVYEKASSAAALLAISCKWRIAHEDAMFGFHPIQIVLQISAARLGDEGKLPLEIWQPIETMKKRMENLLVKRTRLEEKIPILMACRTFIPYTAYEAYKLGIVDEVMTKKV
jgi:ATP-dependent protease ClpP protease subunit